MKTPKELKAILEKRLHRPCNVFLKDLSKLLEAKRSNEWLEVHRTRLYMKQGIEYCVLLEILQEEVL